MEPRQPTSTSTRQNASPLIKVSLPILLAVAIGLIAIAFVVVKLYQRHHNHSAANQPYAYTQLTPYEYTGPSGQTDVGMTFLHPPEMVVKQAVRNNFYQNLVHFSTSNEFVGMIGVLSGEVNAAERNQFLSTGKKYFSEDVSSKDYQLVTTGPLNLNTSWFHSINPHYQASLAKAATLSTPNIHSNAWLMGINVTNTENGKVVAKGETVYILTSKGGYFFTVAANPATWQANTSIWTKIINSLKLDQ